VVPRGAKTTWPSGGIGGSPVTGLELDGMTVVLGHLDANVYGETAWDEHGRDPGWLEPIAREHRAVLQELIEHGDVLPLRLPGMYADEESLRGSFDAVREALAAALDVVRGQTEWSVHLFQGWPTEEPEAPKAASGRDYLERRKREGERRDTARNRRDSLAGEAYEALSKNATSSRLNSPQDPALRERAQPVLLNSAHLVPRGGESAFFAVVEETNRYIAKEGDLFLEVSGPWPPYSFVGDPLSGLDIGPLGHLL
jgi:hypothetical protein